MEPIEASYQPLAVEDKAYFFFPNSRLNVIQKNKRRPNKARKAVGSSTTDRFNMMTTRKENSMNFKSTSIRTKSSTIESTSINKDCYSSSSLTVTNPKRPLNQ